MEKRESNHRRSDAARKRRNEAKKLARKEKRKKEYYNQKEELLMKEKTIMELQKQVVVLKKHVKKDSKSQVTGTSKVFNGPLNYSMSLVNCHREKSLSVIKTLKLDIPIFKRNDISIDTFELGSGVYGSVFSGYINSIKQKVAIKVFNENSSQKERLAEAMVCRQMAGHPNFPFLFGRVDPDKLLFEFIGDDLTAPTLRVIFKNNTPLDHWKIICLDLVRALSAFHEKGLLHNDIHPGNVLVRQGKYVKLIDFGKVTLMDDPTVYCIKPGSDRQKRYNTIHRHLAYELRNVPGSKTSYQSDIFSMGYVFDKIASHIGSIKLRSVASDMMLQEPEKRTELSIVLYKLSKLG